jgi:hypothetical protein
MGLNMYPTGNAASMARYGGMEWAGPPGSGYGSGMEWGGPPTSYGMQWAGPPVSVSPEWSGIPASALAGLGGGMGAGGRGLGLGTRPLQRPTGLGNTEPEKTNKPGIWGPDGFNLNSIKSIADIIGGFMGLSQVKKANQLARESFNFQKDAYNTNLANSIKSYNMALEGRTNARYRMEGRPQDEAEAYITKNRLGV